MSPQSSTPLFALWPHASLAGLTGAEVRRLSWWFCGLTVAADGVGSNPGGFPAQRPELGLPGYPARAREQASVAVRAAGLQSAGLRENRLFDWALRSWRGRERSSPGWARSGFGSTPPASRVGREPTGCSGRPRLRSILRHRRAWCASCTRSGLARWRPSGAPSTRCVASRAPGCANPRSCSPRPMRCHGRAAATTWTTGRPAIPSPSCHVAEDRLCRVAMAVDDRGHGVGKVGERPWGGNLVLGAGPDTGCNLQSLRDRRAQRLRQGPKAVRRPADQLLRQVRLMI